MSFGAFPNGHLVGLAWHSSGDIGLAPIRTRMLPSVVLGFEDDVCSNRFGKGTYELLNCPGYHPLLGCLVYLANRLQLRMSGASDGSAYFQVFSEPRKAKTLARFDVLGQRLLESLDPFGLCRASCDAHRSTNIGVSDSSAYRVGIGLTAMRLTTIGGNVPLTLISVTRGFSFSSLRLCQFQLRSSPRDSPSSDWLPGSSGFRDARLVPSSLENSGRPATLVSWVGSVPTVVTKGQSQDISDITIPKTSREISGFRAVPNITGFLSG
eukprot:IDg1324t1